MILGDRGRTGTHISHVGLKPIEENRAENSDDLHAAQKHSIVNCLYEFFIAKGDSRANGLVQLAASNTFDDEISQEIIADLACE